MKSVISLVFHLTEKLPNKEAENLELFFEDSPILLSTLVKNLPAHLENLASSADKIEAAKYTQALQIWNERHTDLSWGSSVEQFTLTPNEKNQSLSLRRLRTSKLKAHKKP